MKNRKALEYTNPNVPNLLIITTTTTTNTTTSINTTMITTSTTTTINHHHYHFCYYYYQPIPLAFLLLYGQAENIFYISECRYSCSHIHNTYMDQTLFMNNMTQPWTFNSGFHKDCEAVILSKLKQSEEWQQWKQNCRKTLFPFLLFALPPSGQGFGQMWWPSLHMPLIW